MNIVSLKILEFTLIIIHCIYVTFVSNATRLVIPRKLRIQEVINKKVRFFTETCILGTCAIGMNIYDCSFLFTH